MDLKITNGDLDLSQNDFAFVTGAEAIRQDIELTFRTFLAESVYDRSVGVPYLQVIFRTGTSKEAISFICEQVLLSIDGVTDVLELDTFVDREVREFTATGRVLVEGQEVPISVGGISP